MKSTVDERQDEEIFREKERERLEACHQHREGGVPLSSNPSARQP